MNKSVTATVVKEHVVKSIFRSKTFLGIAATFCLAMIPYIDQIQEDNQITLEEILLGVGLVATTLGATKGRVDVGDVYTPPLIPGPDKSSIIHEQSTRTIP